MVPLCYSVVLFITRRFAEENTGLHGGLYLTSSLCNFVVPLCYSVVLFITRRFSELTQGCTEGSVRTLSLCYSVIPLWYSVVPLVHGVTILYSIHTFPNPGVLEIRRRSIVNNIGILYPLEYKYHSMNPCRQILV